MVISKGSYGHREFKIVSPYSVQIPYLPLCGSKLPRFMGGIGPRMEICGNSGLHIPIVPRLHQSNGCMKRKLRAWRVQKCIALVGANTILTSLGPETTAVSNISILCPILVGADTVLTTAWKQSTPFNRG